jgi:transcriptional regulator GlxA family with amidase domain
MSNLSNRRPTVYGFYLVPDFALMAFTSVLEPLRAANAISGRALYRWLLLTKDGAPAMPSTGLKVMADGSIAQHRRLDRVVICTGGAAHLFDDAATFAWLRRQARGGVALGAVADGSFLLARGGLLDGYRCAIHWLSHPSFRESFPQIALSASLYVIDRDRFTSAGGTAAFDMMLEVIARDHGRPLAMQVAEWFVHDPVKAGADRQRLALRVRTGVSDPTVLRAISLMEDHIEEPLRIARLAELSVLSQDRLERRFRQHTGLKPQEYYMLVRLQRAHALLASSALPIKEIALACGFVSASHFARRYQRLFHRTPRMARAPLAEEAQAPARKRGAGPRKPG